MFELWGWGSDYSELETSISQEFPPQRMVCVCVLTVHYVCTGALHTEWLHLQNHRKWLLEKMHYGETKRIIQGTQISSQQKYKH